MLLLERNNRVLTDCYKPHYLVRRQLPTYLHNSTRKAQLVEILKSDTMIICYSLEIVSFFVKSTHWLPHMAKKVATIFGLLFVKREFV